MNAALELAVDAGAARALTDRIKTGVEAVWELIKQAYEQRAWDALGYACWDDYCTREFGTSRLRLPREERPEVVASLRESGLSLRAIASGTGLSVNTIRKELDQVYQTDTPPDPAGDRADAIAEELIEQQLPPLPENYMDVPGAVTDSTPGQTDRVSEAIAKAKAQASPETGPPPTIGRDGKSYSQTASPSRRRPLPESFGDAVSDLTRILTRIDGIVSDDRFEKNADQMAHRVSDLVRARDALQRVISKFDR